MDRLEVVAMVGLSLPQGVNEPDLETFAVCVKDAVRSALLQSNPGADIEEIDPSVSVGKVEPAEEFFGRIKDERVPDTGC